VAKINNVILCVLGALGGETFAHLWPTAYGKGKPLPEAILCCQIAYIKRLHAPEVFISTFAAENVKVSTLQ